VVTFDDAKTTVDKIVKELKDGGISVRGRPLLRVITR
jgi:hypothetical protein